ncbi:MAG: DNA translocase FtsK [Acidimicrobiia bacterium]|nr:DNA translocase FtsK [Acidimicrobiia bacterium]
MPQRKPTRGGASGRKRASKSKNTPGRWARLRAAIRERLGRQTDDMWGLVLLVASAVLLLGFLGLAGPFGRLFVPGLRILFGVWAIFVPVAMAIVGLTLVFGRATRDQSHVPLGLVVLFLGTLALFHLLTGTIPLAEGVDRVQSRGGVVGSLAAYPLRRLVGLWGALVVLFATISVGVMLTTRTTVREVFLAFGDTWRWVRFQAARLWALSHRRRRAVPVAAPPPAVVEAPAPAKDRPAASKPKSAPAKTRPGTKSKKSTPVPVTTRGGEYQMPPIDLLTLGTGGGQNKRSLESTGRELEETLRQHGVDARLSRIVPGPTVTRYEIELAPGVKVARVTSLASDIGYALATPDVRILAPIPGKSAIGVEVPNLRRRLVTLGDILSSKEATENTNPLGVGLGMDISGTPTMLNLNELPHVLIAGATGAGKSSCINSIVTSLLLRARPEDVRLIMVDPKRVELGQYNGVPHLLTRVITNPRKAADALRWAVDEMDRRYELVADSGVRDIVGYHEKWDAGALDPEKFDRFPYIVVVVDELNDLMMVAGKIVEDAIVRIAQMARAIGIHLVIATQRPSVDVITGVIKANIPSRLAFSVASQADSRVILDSAGAEKLIGLGDMLVATARDPKPERIQGSWVEESEVHAVVAWVKQQAKAQYDNSMFEVAEQQAKAVEDAEGEDPDIIRQATELIVRSQLGSTSMLQRKLRIGFARAGRVMDILENKGVVGPSEGSKAREVLIQPDEIESVLS